MKIRLPFFLLTIFLCGCVGPQLKINNKTFLPTANNNNQQAIDKTNATTTILALGDIMTSRVVGQKMLKHGYDYPFIKVKDLLAGADITFANLETSITPGRQVLTGEMMFRSDIEVATILKRYGISIVSLANNHTPNYGQNGLLDTFKYLSEAGVEYVGAGKNIDEAKKLKITKVNKIKIGWLAYNADDVVPASYQASDKRPGTIFMDIEKMKQDIISARPQADLLFVSMHAGAEYTELPNKTQIEFAHAAIDAGADLIIGHHPHVVQHLEKYKDKFIIYSLGNFIFDQMWSLPTRQGMAVKILINEKNIKALQFFPIMIEDYCQPRLADKNESPSILKALNYSLTENGLVYYDK
jgi:poly-gamma-glutamate synthesis protein (capsule biosynthesis protein)